MDTDTVYSNCEDQKVGNEGSGTIESDASNSVAIGNDKGDNDGVQVLLTIRNVTNTDEEDKETSDDLVIEQEVENDGFDANYKANLRAICITVLGKFKKLEDSKNMKTLEIANELATYLKSQSPCKLYTLEKAPRNSKSSEDSYYLKASPPLLLAYETMKSIYLNSGIERVDASMKTFTWYVIQALFKLDQDLEPIDKYKFKKIHLAESRKDNHLIYWLDPIQPNDLVPNDLGLTTKNKKRKGTSSDITLSNSDVTQKKSERISALSVKPPESTPVTDSVKIKATKSKKKTTKKTIINKMKTLCKEAAKRGVKIKELRTMCNVVYEIDDDDVDVRCGNVAKKKENIKDVNTVEKDRRDVDEEVNEDGNEKDKARDRKTVEDIAYLIKQMFTRKCASYIKVPKVMEWTTAIVDDKFLEFITKDTKKDGMYKNGIYQNMYRRRENIDIFYDDIATQLKLFASNTFGFVVTNDTTNEVFERAVEECKYFTLITGYTPNTIIRTFENKNGVRKIEDIELDKGDLLILNDSLEYTFGSETYTTDKVFEVVYLFFNDQR